MKKLLAMLVSILLVSGCAYLNPQPTYTQEDIERETETRRYNDAFDNVYKSDLSIWVGKSPNDLPEAFRGWASLKSQDVYGNGYIVYKPFSYYYYSHKELTFYIRNGKIYNVVKE